MPALVLPQISRSMVGPDDDEMSTLARVARTKLQMNEIPSDEEMAALETDTLVQRPALRFVDGEPEELWPGSMHKAGWEEFVATIRPLTGSIGRIDLGARPLGTGFVVRPGYVVTNRHVAVALLDQSGVVAGAVIRFGLQDEAALDLDTVPITAFVAAHETLDVALLALGADPRPRTPLVVSTDPPAQEQPVATVGYPFPDDDRNPLSEDLFAPPTGVQRVAPGDIGEVVNGFLWHDCSTLGGNSGSPLLDRGTGHVVGVHFEGLYLATNKAVAGADLATFMASSL